MPARYKRTLLICTGGLSVSFSVAVISVMVYCSLALLQLEPVWFEDVCHLTKASLGSVCFVLSRLSDKKECSGIFTPWLPKTSESVGPEVDKLIGESFATGLPALPSPRQLEGCSPRCFPGERLHLLVVRLGVENSISVEYRNFDQ